VLYERRDILADQHAAHEKQLEDLYAEIGRLTRIRSGWRRRVNTQAPHLPDGRQFVRSVGRPAARHSVLHARR